MAVWPRTTIPSQVYNQSDYDLFSDNHYDHESPFNTSEWFRQPSEELISADYLRTKEPNSTCKNFPTNDFEVHSCRFIVKVLLNTILCLVGFIGNSVTIAVLRRDRDPQRQRSTNFLLETLAVADVIFLAFAFFFYPFKRMAMRSEALTTVSQILPYLITYLYPFAAIAHIMTIWIVVLVTFDRYLAICKPLRTDLRSVRRLKMTVGVLFILAVILNLPHFFEIEVAFSVNCEDGELQADSFQREFVDNVYYKYIYEVGLDFLFRSAGPLIILVILNVRLICTIRALNKKQHVIALHRPTKEDNTLTVMLIIVVVIFVTCQVPMSVLSFVFRTTVFFPDTINRSDEARCALKLARTLLVLNSSINFLVYCLIWRKFNRILVRMMMTCCRKKTNNQIWRTKNTSSRFACVKTDTSAKL